MTKRITVRFNDVEELELNLLKKKYNISDESKAIKFAISFANKYLDNVTNFFFGSDYNITLHKKTKTYDKENKVFTK